MFALWFKSHPHNLNQKNKAHQRSWASAYLQTLHQEDTVKISFLHCSGGKNAPQRLKNKLGIFFFFFFTIEEHGVGELTFGKENIRDQRGPEDPLGWCRASHLRSRDPASWGSALGYLSKQGHSWSSGRSADQTNSQRMRNHGQTGSLDPVADSKHSYAPPTHLKREFNPPWLSLNGLLALGNGWSTGWGCSGWFRLIRALPETLWTTSVWLPRGILRLVPQQE